MAISSSLPESSSSESSTSLNSSRSGSFSRFHRLRGSTFDMANSPFLPHKNCSADENIMLPSRKSILCSSEPSHLAMNPTSSWRFQMSPKFFFKSSCRARETQPAYFRRRSASVWPPFPGGFLHLSGLLLRRLGNISEWTTFPTGRGCCPDLLLHPCSRQE